MCKGRALPIVLFMATGYFCSKYCYISFSDSFGFFVLILIGYLSYAIMVFHVASFLLPNDVCIVMNFSLNTVLLCHICPNISYIFSFSFIQKHLWIFSLPGPFISIPANTPCSAMITPGIEKAFILE